MIEKNKQKNILKQIVFRAYFQTCFSVKGEIFFQYNKIVMNLGQNRFQNMLF